MKNFIKTLMFFTVLHLVSQNIFAADIKEDFESTDLVSPQTPANLKDLVVSPLNILWNNKKKVVAISTATALISIAVYGYNQGWTWEQVTQFVAEKFNCNYKQAKEILSKLPWDKIKFWRSGSVQNPILALPPAPEKLITTKLTNIISNPITENEICSDINLMETSKNLTCLATEDSSHNLEILKYLEEKKENLDDKFPSATPSETPWYTAKNLWAHKKEIYSIAIWSFILSGILDAYTKGIICWK